MKILFDTSALFPGFRHEGLRQKLLGRVIDTGHTPVVTDYILDELRINIERRFKPEQKAVALDLLLQILSLNVLEVKLWDEYEAHLDAAFDLVREKDAPVLAAAMLDEVAYLVVRDERDFLRNERLMNSRWRAKIVRPRELFDLLGSQNMRSE